MSKDSRKPEWTPEGAGKEFASRILPAVAPEGKPRPAPHPGKSFDLESLTGGVLASDRTALSKAITLIESNSPKHFEQGQELIKRLLPHSGKSIRIGITGTPGVGKSSFIESFGLWLIKAGHNVAVLAIDPSSTLSKGSILGDKTRMEKLSSHPQSFIRPSPSGGVLGGVARKTRESIVLCEAAGYDIILIETVGVGQSETTVRSMVDFFLLMQITGAGDELQGIKKGIMELADLLVVNKADGDNILRAQQTRVELNNALHYLRQATPGWETTALTCSALEATGMDEIWEQVQAFVAFTRENGYFAQRRKHQVSEWFEAMLHEAIIRDFYAQAGKSEAVDAAREAVASGSSPVMLAIRSVFDS